MTKYRIPVRMVTPPVSPRRTRFSEADLYQSAPKSPEDAREQPGETPVKAVSSSPAAVPEKRVWRDAGGSAWQAAQKAAQE